MKFMGQWSKNIAWDDHTLQKFLCSRSDCTSNPSFLQSIPCDKVGDDPSTEVPALIWEI